MRHFTSIDIIISGLLAPKELAKFLGISPIIVHSEGQSQ